MTAIADYERSLGEHLLAGLATIPGAQALGPADDGRPRPDLLLHARRPSTRTPSPQHLADRGIFAWAGHFYAVEAIDRLGLADAGGLLRVGLCHYSTTHEVDRLIAALREL